MRAGRGPSRGVRRGLLVTATDTGVGKTVLAAALCAALRERGEAVLAHKPVLTGLDEAAEPGTRDHELLAACTGQTPEEVTPRCFGPAVSPHLAAALVGEELTLDELLAAIPTCRGPLVVEGVGGLLVPFAEAFGVRELARALDLPVVVAARPGLGTINHTRLTVEAARAAGLEVRAVVLTPWSQDPSAMEQDNAGTIAALAEVDVLGLAFTALDPRSLALAGRTLADALVP